MKNCLKCGSTNTSEIADGLVLCPSCERQGNWVIVEDIETKELRWKDILNDTIVDEEIQL